MRYLTSDEMAYSDYRNGGLTDVTYADVERSPDGNLWIAVGSLRCNVHPPVPGGSEYGIRWIERADGFTARGDDVADALR
jgi:hypothetical protein